MAPNATASSGLAAANGNGSLKTRSAVAVKALKENRLDPIAIKALDTFKTGSEQEVVEFLDFLRKNGLEARFTEVTKLINKNRRLSEAERQVLKYKLAKIAKESLEDLGTGSSDVDKVDASIKDVSTAINEKEIINYERLEEIAQSMNDNGQPAKEISTAIDELTAAFKESAAGDNDYIEKILAAMQVQANNMEGLVKTTTRALAALNSTVAGLPTEIAKLIKADHGENQ